MEQIPILDLGSFQSSQDFEKNLEKISSSLKAALSLTGFVYLKNHGVSEESIHKVFEESRAFFKLPVETKMTLGRDFQKTFHGYTKIGGERMTKESAIELRESFDVAVQSGLQVPFPDEEVPGFRPALNKLTSEAKALTYRLLTLIALALGKEKDFFIPLHKNIEDASTPNFTQLRTLMYPQIKSQREDLVGCVRCAEHTDYGTITLLFQDDAGGLEVKGQSGEWIPVKPIRNTVVMNVGDLLEIWSGGLFPSTVHRVVIPKEDVELENPRQSVALFLKPDNSTFVKPLGNVREGFAFKFGWEEDGVFAGDHFKKRTIYHRQLAGLIN